MYFFGGNIPILTIVVPCYNEESVLNETTIRLTRVIEELIMDHSISKDSQILYVDDGSIDHTWNTIEDLGHSSPFVKGLKLARNVGHQNALIAGLNIARNQADCVVSIDADLQDDVEVIKEFIQHYQNGYDVVYGVRQERKTDTFFKRTTALAFYKLMKVMGVNIVNNHADYRLISHRVLNCLGEFRETNLFLRGIIPLIGFKSTEVYYDRNERFAGESKYPLRKMLALGWEGITSFSVVPIRFVTYAGFVFMFLCLIASIYILGVKTLGHTASGWTSLMLSIWFIGGIQLIGLGIVGEYIGKIYKESKGRPKYIVELDNYSNPNRINQAIDSKKNKILVKI
ncbi:glycosyltransferase family 2 protein [Neobacillus sp. PS3-34]|uniref:glycosyltransferase family 2 protein n=1 Tax=Neobacillus sp. PS3-34 TaxID=3070678 RepID=UPI0027DED6F8|nr:glycosyltransferase family 2 protein [Neobacillus sp. PS3-34]WML47823.1 glycosyltransferase family 2 protein [Neobacillus sp. PS3-34]